MCGMDILKEYRVDLFRCINHCTPFSYAMKWIEQNEQRNKIKRENVKA